MVALSRRRFARWLGLSTAAVFLPRDLAQAAPGPLPATPPDPDERFWEQVRARFVLRRDVGYLNAANLCPTSRPVLEALEARTRAFDEHPLPATRTELSRGRESARTSLARMLGVAPEEIVITRNTSEANNLVSSGLTLGPGDEVVVFADNHPSNLAAWQVKAKRFGFAVVTVPQVNPHPGAEAYVEAFTRAFTPRTRVLAVTQVTNSVGDLLPVAELCRAARDRGILSLVDGAQAFGVLDTDLRAMQPDFYSGSVHKWLCGPKETGVLYVSLGAQERLTPSLVSLYPGAVGISKTLEGMGQRDDAAVGSVAEAVAFQEGIGRAAIEQRARELAHLIIEGLRDQEGVRLWTHPDPARSAAVVTFRPGSADPRTLAAALAEEDRVVCVARGGQDRPGLRFSPHFYNTRAEVQRAIEAVRRHVRG